MEIPAYPDARRLEPGDKTLLDQLFQRLQPRVSELTFAGLYLFRHAHDYRLTLVGDAVLLLGQGYDGRPYFLPPLGGDIPRALDLLFDRGMELYGADEQFVARHLAGRWVELVEDRDSFDYLYLREELADLPGTRFMRKRNRISYFVRHHDHRCEPYRPDHRQGCRELLTQLGGMAEAHLSPSLRLELDASGEALELVEELGLQGLVVMVADRVAAFTLGERLNPDTAVCHFEKADPFMEGLAQLVNREFSARLFTECRFVNREQDLGVAGLRNAKLSYHPVELVRKYRVRRSPAGGGA
jgi:hypothetical protein